MFSPRTIRNFMIGLVFFMCLMFVGGTANQIVVIANGGSMPVEVSECLSMPGEILDRRHMCASPETKFAILDDRYLSPDGRAVFSLGDALLVSGQYGLMLIVLTMGIGSLFTKSKN